MSSEPKLDSLPARPPCSNSLLPLDKPPVGLPDSSDRILPAPSALRDNGQIPPATEENPAHLICDLSKGHAFSPSYEGPPVPVLLAFGADPLSDCHVKGTWDFDRAIAENPKRLLRSIRRLEHSDKLDKWEDVLLQFGERAFLYGDDSRIWGYASTPAEAERIVRDFTESYGNKIPPTGGSFQLIRKSRHSEITCENVDLAAETILTEEAFALHYPTDTGEWHRAFVGKLISRKSGLSILEGSPGTGKTSYLRHLMGQLKDSHRFYFIPPISLSILTEPEFIGFWSSEREAYSDRKLVVILEDADAALLTRASDNREQVSAILNLSDGMLSDFLGLQVICTINCAATDIDQALLRPGRLVSHRVFRRLDLAQATALATAIGKTLPQAQDYSLAEIFTEQESEVLPRPRMGFSV